MEKCDVKIKRDNEAFKFRVAGIIKHENKVLVAKANNYPYYNFPGGHVELLEDTKSAVQRELTEELYFKIKVGKLFCVHENFYRNRNKNFHELCFYYLVDVDEEEFDFSDKIYTENDNGFEITYDYKWVEINDLTKYNVQPKDLIEKLKNIPDNVLHIINKDFS